MATTEQIIALRLLIDEQTADLYTDDTLSDRLDVAESAEQLASVIWLEKAARYARLVDMQEGTSRRSLSQLQEQALTMSSRLSTASGTSGGGARGATTRAIERI